MKNPTPYREFFEKATGHAPYSFQRRLAQGSWPNMLNVPTGLGKTAAVTLAWLYRRQELKQDDIPRRLVWCLPMRVLVEQTRANVEDWLERLNLLGNSGDGKVSVHLLMGGEPTLRRAAWASFPEEDAILIGTQDMLLSRALMRGYGMSRYQWPVHFALLHNDALWVYDEVQLMGPALPTTAQLEAFRADFNVPKRSRSLWVSATLDPNWLGTVDFRDRLATMDIAKLGDDDRHETGVARRLQAVKSLQPAPTVLTSENAKARATAYIESLASEVAEAHRPGQQTLVIVNRVERAQSLFQALKKKLPEANALLLHARFRAAERKEIESQLRREVGADSHPHGRVIVATQAVEAGVDLSSAVLFTELAPWSSLVQRFGRCNRAGEHEQAEIRWVDIDDETNEAAPYTAEALSAARRRLQTLNSASPADLPEVDEAAPPAPVLRRKDFIQLFDTDPDLSGFDVDISPYIRDPGSPQVQAFWRDFDQRPEPGISPEREELCPAGLGQVTEFLRKKGRKVWSWDSLAGRWQATTRPRPGQVLLLHATDGGYTNELGFTAGSTQMVQPVAPSIQERTESPESNNEDVLTFIGREVTLDVHLRDAADQLETLAHSLNLPDWQRQAAATADLWHDLGKAHEAFQRGIQADYIPGQSKVLAKSGGKGRPNYHVIDENGKRLARRGFRHELASMLAWLEHGDDAKHQDLIAYLICAHHGRVRMSLRALPDEPEPPDAGRLFARGVWHGDRLSATTLNGFTVPETELRLDLMRLGHGRAGPSWTERTRRLLDCHGPFELAWLEALVRIADWRASREEAAGGEFS